MAFPVTLSRVAVALAICFTTTFTATSQEIRERQTDFLFQTYYSLGPFGFQTSYRARLTDENNFSYDMMSLLNSGGRSRVGVSDDQHYKLQTIFDDAVNQMKEQTKDDPFSVDQSELEKIYRKAELEAGDILTEAQKEQLRLFRHQKAIERVGLAKYLKSSHFKKFGALTKDEIAALKNLEEAFDKLKTKKSKNALRMANQKLLSLLTKDQRKRFKDTFSSTLEDRFLKSPLFVSFSPTKMVKSSKTGGLLQVAKLKKIPQDTLSFERTSLPSSKTGFKGSKRSFLNSLQRTIQETTTPDRHSRSKNLRNRSYDLQKILGGIPRTVSRKNERTPPSRVE